jgi:hypothetical protein
VSDKGRLKLIKHQLAVLIRRGNRNVPFSEEYPTKWWFGQVIDPRSHKYFTPVGAWDFIAENLEDPGTKIREIVLEKPEGRKAYELLLPTKKDVIYIKIHFGGKGDTVIGRSFHYSEER